MISIILALQAKALKANRMTTSLNTIENQKQPDLSGSKDMLNRKLLNDVAECQRGQNQAFAPIYDHFLKKIYDYIYYRTHHRQTAEDLTSFAFTKAFQNIRTFNPDQGTLQGWLYRIAHNVLVDHFRTFKATSDIEDAWDAKIQVNYESDLDVKDKLSEVEQYLVKLSAEHRELVIMRVWDDLSYAEIAEITGKTESSLKMSMSRILAKLRNEIVAAIITLLIVN